MLMQLLNRTFSYVCIYLQAAGNIWFAPCWHGNALLPCSLKMHTRHCWRLCKTSLSVGHKQAASNEHIDPLSSWTFPLWICIFDMWRFASKCSAHYPWKPLTVVERVIARIFVVCVKMYVWQLSQKWSMQGILFRFVFLAFKYACEWPPQRKDRINRILSVGDMWKRMAIFASFWPSSASQFSFGHV